jgi:hypothetical protein
MTAQIWPWAGSHPSSGWPWLLNVSTSAALAKGEDYPAGFQDKAVYYPNVFVSKQQVEEMLSEHYHIKFKIIEDKAVYRVGSKEIDMFGYFCIRKS